jgi:hypothetical protein
MANTVHGYNETTCILRSVLHHKLGLPFACFFYSPESYYRVMVEHFPELPLQLDGQRQRQRARQKHFDHVLSKSCENWLTRAAEDVPGETDFTTLLSQEMAEVLRPYELTVEHNKQLANTTYRPDIVVRTASTRHPVLAIEVGLSNADWWQKVDQCLMYSIWLRDSQRELKHPVLLTVLTIESVMKKNQSVFSKARIGTFLATSTKSTPSVVHDFRLALLHRAETTSATILSVQLGQLMRAACLLPAWASAPSPTPLHGGRPRHEYLGPNCRRVGSNVSARSRVSLSIRLSRSNVLTTCHFRRWTYVECSLGVPSLRQPPRLLVSTARRVHHLASREAAVRSQGWETTIS